MMNTNKNLRLLWPFSLLVALFQVFLAGPTLSQNLTSSPSQYPIGGLCRRWDHRTALVDNTLYLLGGRVLTKDILNTPIGFSGLLSNEFISLDLTKSFKVGNALFNASKEDFPPWEPVGYSISAASDYKPTIVNNNELFDGRPKTSQNQPEIYLSGGMLWRVNSSLVLVDGVVYYDNISDPSTLWTFDTIEGEWDMKKQYQVPDATNWPKRYYRGGYTASNPNLNNGESIAFRVGGARVWDGGDAEDRSYWFHADEQLLSMDLNDQDWTKKTSNLDSNEKSIGAAVTWIPIGEKGCLVSIGGTIETAARIQSGGKDDDPKSVSDLVRPSEEIRIYDIAQEKWYSQTATKAHSDQTDEIPYQRMDACSIAISAEDNSWHAIYFYAGGSGSGMFSTPEDDSYYGDVFVLLLPAFRWFRATIPQDTPNMVPYRRTRHRCHRVGKKMLVIGGTSNDQKLTAANAVYPTFTKSTCEYDEIHVLDISTLQWDSEWKGIKEAGSIAGFQPNVNRSIGNEPEKGWSSNDLKELFDESPTSKKGSGLGYKAVIGIIFGAIFFAAVVAMALGYFCCYRRRRRAAVADREQMRQVFGSNRDSYGLAESTAPEEGPREEKAYNEAGIGNTARTSTLSEAAAAGRRRTQFIAAELDSRPVSELGSDSFFSSVKNPGSNRGSRAPSALSGSGIPPEASPLAGASRPPKVGPIYEME